MSHCQHSWFFGFLNPVPRCTPSGPRGILRKVAVNGIERVVDFVQAPLEAGARVFSVHSAATFQQLKLDLAQVLFSTTEISTPLMVIGSPSLGCSGRWRWRTPKIYLGVLGQVTWNAILRARLGRCLRLRIWCGGCQSER